MKGHLLEMEDAFCEEFRQWWPFAQELLLKGGRVNFHIALQVTKASKGEKGPTWFVQGSLDTSHKATGEVIDFVEGRKRRNR